MPITQINLKFMIETKITKKLVDQVLKMLEIETAFKKESYFCELQDDSLLLFISIPMTEEASIEPTLIYKSVGFRMNKMMPNRANDYSWMVSFTKNKKIIHSVFGGNLSSPNSGL
jgi:hypothetical protein